MSMLLMVKAMGLKIGNPTRKLVLLKLADNANDDGNCFPSYQYIADACEISKRSAISHIDSLVKSGLISKKSRKNKDGSSSNLYILHLDSDGENSALGGENISLGSENSALGGSENISPITSHSINQSVNHRKTKQKTAAENIVLPDWINRDDWIAYCKHREEIKKPLGEKAAKLGISKLERLRDSGENVSEVINQTIFGGWTGFFAVKKDSVKSVSDNEFPEIDFQQVIDDFNEIFSERFNPVELNQVTKTAIIKFAPHLRKQTNQAFRAYFTDFNENAKADYWQAGRKGFSDVVRPETLQRTRERSL